MADSSLSNRVGFSWRFPGRAIAAGALAWLYHLRGVVGQCQKSGGIVVCQGPPDDLTPQGDVRSLVLSNEWFTPVHNVIRQLYPNVTSVECPFRGVAACSGDELDSTCPCFATFGAQTRVIDGTSMLPNTCADDPVDLLGAEAEYVVLTTLGVVVLAIATRTFGRRVVQWVVACCRRTPATEKGQEENEGDQDSDRDDDSPSAAASSSIQRGGDDTRVPLGIDWTVVSGLVEARAQLLAYSKAHESGHGAQTGADVTRSPHCGICPNSACSGNLGNGATGESDEDNDTGGYEVMRSPTQLNPFLEENGRSMSSPNRGGAMPSSICLGQGPSPACRPVITSTPLGGTRPKPKNGTSSNVDRLSHIVEVECEEAGEEEAAREKKERSRLKKLRNSFAGFGKDITHGGRSPSLADIRDLGIDLSQPLDGGLLESLAPVFMKAKSGTPRGDDSGVYTGQSVGSRRRGKPMNPNSSGGGRSMDESSRSQSGAMDSLEGMPTNRCRVV